MLIVCKTNVAMYFVLVISVAQKNRIFWKNPVFAAHRFRADRVLFEKTKTLCVLCETLCDLCGKG